MKWFWNRRKTIATTFFWFMIIGIFLSSLSIKMWNLIQAYSFDDDEIFSALFIRNTWLDILSLRVYDPGNPPLYFIILKLWTGIFSDGEIGIRSFSLMVDSVSFWLLFWFCKKKFNFNRFQLITISTMFSFSQAMFYYSIYGRAYALLVFLCVLILYFWIGDTREFINWRFVSASLVGLFLHYSTIFFLFFLAMGIAINNGVNESEWKNIKKLVVNYILIIIGYLPWIIMFIRDQVAPIDDTRKYPFWQIYSSSDHLKTRIGRWLTIISNGLINLNDEWSSLIIIISGLLLVMYLIKNIRVIKKNKFNIVLITVLVFLINLYYLGLGTLLVTERYSLFILPLVWVCFVGITLKKINWCKIFIIVVLLGFWVVNQDKFYIPVNGNSGKKLAESSISGKVVILEECCYENNFNYYYNGHGKVECGLSLEKIEISNREEVVLLENKWNDESSNLWTSVDVENWITSKKYTLLNAIEFNNGYTIYQIENLGH